MEMNRVEQLKAVQTEGLELFTRKNADYGDAFAKYGVVGVLMRIEDKIQRAMSITKNGVNLVDNEGMSATNKNILKAMGQRILNSLRL